MQISTKNTFNVISYEANQAENRIKAKIEMQLHCFQE